VHFSRYVPAVDARTVLAQLRPPLRLLGWAFLLPLSVALISREFSQALVFGALALVTWIVGGRRELRGALTPRDAIVFAALAYLVFALVGALAYLPSTSFVDGFFESMSGFTTTGLSVLDLERTSRSLLFFRAYSQWMGGAGIMVLSIAFLPGARQSLLPLFAAEFREENLLGNVVSTTRLVFTIYGALTIAGFVVFLACGMSAFDAGLHVFATLSTGGFSPYPDSIGHFRSTAVTIAVSFFMLLGALALPLYYRGAREGPRKFFADSQLKALFTLSFAGFLLVLVLSSPAAGLTSLVDHAFLAISSLTTTGFSTTDPRSWSEGPRLVSMALMIFGGSAGSTAGGIKLFRVLALAAITRWYLMRALLPAGAQVPLRYGGRNLRDDEMKSMVGFAILYLGLIAASSMLLTVTGCRPLDALFEVTSAVGTAGLSVGITSAELPAWAKLLLALDMWAGRLEVLPVLVLLYPRHWVRREST
jgi:trk system potassium uptake protein TrkH